MSGETQQASEETKVAFHQALVDAFETPEERQWAKAQLTEIGIDFTDEEPPSAEDAAKAAEDAAKAADEEAAKAAEEAAKAKADEEAAKAAADPKKTGEETKAEEKPDPELEQLRTELSASNARIAELEAKEQLAGSETEIRKEVSDAMRATLEQHKADDAETDAKITKYREDYGEEAAKDLEAQVAENRKLRDAETQRQIEEEFAKRKSAAEDSIAKQIELQKEIGANPDISAWKKENGLNWQLAVAYDEHLKTQEEWKDKPQSERFGEVVKLVKEHNGTVDPGSQKSADDTKETAEEERKKQAEAILKESRSKSNAGSPTSLTDIPGEQGGDATAGLTHEKLGDMDTTEIYGLLAARPDTIDKLLSQPEFYETVEVT